MSQLLASGPAAAERSGLHSAARDDAPADEFRVTVVRDLTALRDQLPAWRRLAETSLEPNIFYEPLMLMPAFEQLGIDRHLEFVLVTAPVAKDRAAPPVWCGLFPLERHRGFHGLPVETLRTWWHIHAPICTPLVRADVAAETIAAFFDWLDRDSGATLFGLHRVSGDGPFQHHWVDELHRRERPVWVADWHTRAILRRAADADTYVRSALRRKRRIEIERLERRLGEQGQLEYQALAADDDLDAWLDDFLAIEATGWKGRGSSAIVCSPTERAFFRAAAREAFELGRLMMLRLRLDGRTIAAKCNFLSGDGGFAFKIAFEESLARYSPGVLLELENIRRVHARPDLNWMDSCADPDHPMINRLWRERGITQSLWMGTGGRAGDWIVSAAPLMRRLKYLFRRRPAYRAATSNHLEPHP